MMNEIDGVTNIVISMKESTFYITDKNGWLKFKAFIDDMKTYRIKSLALKFRSHIERVAPDEADAYSYWGGIQYTPGMERPQKTIMIGWVSNGHFYVSKWLEPELIFHSFEERELTPAYEEMLIYNGKKNN